MTTSRAGASRGNVIRPQAVEAKAYEARWNLAPLGRRRRQARSPAPLLPSSYHLPALLRGQRKGLVASIHQFELEDFKAHEPHSFPSCSASPVRIALPFPNPLPSNSSDSSRALAASRSSPATAALNSKHPYPHVGTDSPVSSGARSCASRGAKFRAIPSVLPARLSCSSSL
jgi:hypothetical protein